MNKINRELSRAERTEIRDLVVKSCVNYDYEYGCLPLDCKCYMLSKRFTGSLCKYFNSAVLPTNPALGLALSNQYIPTEKKCEICGKSFFPIGRQKYCGSACVCEGNRRASCERMRKKRRTAE